MPKAKKRTQLSRPPPPARTEPMDPEAKRRTHRLLAARRDVEVGPDYWRTELQKPPEPVPALLDLKSPQVEIMRCARCGRAIQAVGDPGFEEHTRKVVGAFEYVCGECTARGIENGTIDPRRVVKLF